MMMWQLNFIAVFCMCFICNHSSVHNSSNWLSCVCVCFFFQTQAWPILLKGKDLIGIAQVSLWLILLCSVLVVEFNTRMKTGSSIIHLVWILILEQEWLNSALLGLHGLK